METVKSEGYNAARAAKVRTAVAYFCALAVRGVLLALLPLCALQGALRGAQKARLGELALVARALAALRALVDWVYAAMLRGVAQLQTVAGEGGDDAAPLALHAFVAARSDALTERLAEAASARFTELAARVRAAQPAAQFVAQSAAKLAARPAAARAKARTSAPAPRAENSGISKF